MRNLAIIALLILVSGPGLTSAVRASVPAPAVADAQRTAAALVEAPTLDVPLDGSLLGDFGLTLIWRNPTGATQNQLQVIPAKDGGPGINLIVNATPSYFIPAPPEWYGLLPGMTYTWRVRASDAKTAIDEKSPAWGPWAEATFRTPAVSASTLRPVSPPNGATVTVARPILQWSETHNRVFYYEVQLSRDSGFNTDPATAVAPLYWELRHGGVTAPVNSYRVPESVTLVEGATYYWRVRPRVQGDGIAVPWGQTSSFVLSGAARLPDLPGGELGGGTLDLERMTVPAGATVKAAGATTLLVAGPVIISGNLVSEGADLAILAQGDITVGGSISTATGAAAQSSNGGSITLQSGGEVTISGAIATGNGTGSPATVQAVSVMGHVLSASAGPAGSGGHVRVAAEKGIKVGSGARLVTGSGAAGAGVEAMAGTVSDELVATGGNGGSGGDVVLRGASVALPESGTVFVLGDGAAGGTASYTGAVNGAGQASGGRAVGGAGGHGGQLKLSPEQAWDRLAPLVTGGGGGNGGGATGVLAAVSGPAAVAQATDRLVHGKDQQVQGGNGDDGTPSGGDGGEAVAPSGGVGSGGGWGGQSVARGGTGGLATDPSGTGGRGGDAHAGRGGNGSDGPKGGPGGSSRADGGLARGDNNAGGGGRAWAGRGGDGGNGQECPGGWGGEGGWSQATGGDGRPGGSATTGVGGNGGKGASCCTPPRAGGSGGPYGQTHAHGGEGVNGLVGADGGKAEAKTTGNGGRGGNGAPPGAGGWSDAPKALGGRPGTGPLGDGVKGAETKGARGEVGLEGAWCPGVPRPTPTPTPPSIAPPGDEDGDDDDGGTGY